MISRAHRNRAITCLPVHPVARRGANLIDAAVQRRCVLEISRELNFLGKPFGIVSREATRRFSVTAQFSQMVHFTSWNIFLIFPHFSKSNLPLNPPLPLWISYRLRTILPISFVLLRTIYLLSGILLETISNAIVSRKASFDKTSFVKNMRRKR